MQIYQGPLFQSTIDEWNTTTLQIGFTYSRMHTYLGQMYPYSNCQAQIYGIPLQQISFTYSRMHIYQGPLLLQLTINIGNNTTPNTVSHIPLCIYTQGRCTSSGQSTIDLNGIPLHQINFTYSIMQIYLRQMYSVQSTIDEWNTTTPNRFHLQQNAHIPRPPYSNCPQIYGIPLHQISFTYSRMHIYQGPPSIDHNIGNNTTPNKVHIYHYAYIPRADVPSSN